MRRRTFGHYDSEEAALEAAAEAPRKDLEELRDKVLADYARDGHEPDADGLQPAVVRLLDHIRAHFLQKSLNVATSCRAAAVAESTVKDELKGYSDNSIGFLIAKCRVLAAIHLLLNTRLAIPPIGHLVGFKTYSTFIATYKKFVREAPTATRRKARVDPAAGVAFDLGDLGLLSRVGAGELSLWEQERLGDSLAELYPKTFGGDEPKPEPKLDLTPPGADSETFERFQATELVWPSLLELSFEEQRQMVRKWEFWTPAPFEFLHKKSREEGRRDRQRGIEVSQLALDCLDGNEPRLRSGIHALRLEGWAWLGNAHRLALDFSSAEEAFRRGKRLLDAHQLGASRAAGTFFFLKGTLRTFERRFPEAFEYYDRAVVAFETAGDVEYQVITLLQRTAALAYGQRFEEIPVTIAKARAALAAQPDEELTFRTEYALTMALAREGEFARAETQLQSIRYQVPDPTDLNWRSLIQWTAALIDHGLGRVEAAEENFVAARATLENTNQPCYAALISLDLAILYSQVGKSRQVLELSAIIYSFFEALRLHDQSAAALKLLGDELAKAEVTGQTLQRLMAALLQDPLAMAH